MSWGIFLDAAFKVLDKIIPDPEKKAAAQLEVLKLQQAGEFKEIETNLALAQGQVDINKIEAASESLFKSGWRPFVGWVCGIAFAMKYMGGPVAFMIAQFFDKHVELPPIDMLEMMPLLFGMLGLGAYRTYEKTRV